MAARRPGEAGTSFGAGRAGASPPPPTLGQWEAVPCHSHGVSGAQWRGVLSPGAELRSTDLRESTQFKERCPERERVTSYPVPRLSACRALQASRGDLGGGGPGPPCCRHSSLPPRGRYSEQSSPHLRETCRGVGPGQGESRRLESSAAAWGVGPRGAGGGPGATSSPPRLPGPWRGSAWAAGRPREPCRLQNRDPVISSLPVLWCAHL